MNATLPPPDAGTYVPPAYSLAAVEPVRPNGKTTLIRPRQGRRIGGVCAALAQRYDWDPTLVRVLVALSVFLPGPQVLAYLAAWVILPSDD